MDQAGDKNYPEPDVPVQEAWENMQQLLQSPVAPAGSGMGAAGKRPGKFMLGAGAGALVIVSMIIYFVTTKKEGAKPSPQITYYSERFPKLDTLADGTIAFLDTLSSITVANLPAKEKQIIINQGGCYFRQLNKSAIAPWQIKVGFVNILPNNANIYVTVDTVAAMAVVQVQMGSAEIQVSQEKLHIDAGESVRISTQHDMAHNKQKLDPNSFSYANKVFEFSNTPFKEVAGYLERAYGVKIMLPRNFHNCTITTKFDNRSLKEVLDILAYTLAFDYTIDEKKKQVLISGDGCN
jgi:ferric-dicitrate binding protein FerR (iron transport regulator)